MRVSTKKALIIAIVIVLGMLITGISMHLANGGSLEPPRKKDAPTSVEQPAASEADAH